MRQSMIRLAGTAVLVLAALCVTACQSGNGSNSQANSQNMTPTTNPSQAGFHERHDVGNGAYGEDAP